jgi:Protein of Unknown function (DUF2784)
MGYRALADVVLVLHFVFIGFVVLGGLLAWRWPAVAWLHLPAVAWGAYVIIAGEICPLTPLEVSLRLKGGEPGFDRSFIEQYLMPIVYPDAVQGPMGRGLQIALGVGVIAVNAIAYACVWRRTRSSRHA